MSPYYLSKAYITNLSYCNTMGPYYLCKAEIKNMPVTSIHVLSHEHLTPDILKMEESEKSSRGFRKKPSNCQRNNRNLQTSSKWEVCLTSTAFNECQLTASLHSNRIYYNKWCVITYSVCVYQILVYMYVLKCARIINLFPHW
jgi:hypothetical protein